MKRKALLLCLVCFCTFLSGCTQKASAYTRFDTSFFDTFDTVVTILGYAKEEATFQEVCEQARAQFERLHTIYDGYHAYEGVANLYYMNQEAAKAPVWVEPELFELLVYCKQYQPQMQGKVNIALGAMLSLWHEYRAVGMASPAAAEIPPMEALIEASAHAAFDDLVLDAEAGTVFYRDPALRIDLGCIAKGYATEKVAQWMLQSEMPSFIINAGGNVRAGNPPEDERQRWGISIQSPDALATGKPSENDLDILFVTNLSVVTSGDYQRYYVVDGVRYHHLISPDTLMPGNFMRSVTVACEDSALADLYSTMLFLMPFEEGIAFVEAQPGVEAYWVLMDGSIRLSSGMGAYAKSQGASSANPMP